MNTHCKISLYCSNRFTVYFEFFCFTWEMFSLYLYIGFCTFMVNRETVINVERYSCQVSYFLLILTERRMCQQILVKSLNMKFHGNQLSGSLHLMCVERQAEIVEFMSLLYECECTYQQCKKVAGSSIAYHALAVKWSYKFCSLVTR